MKQKGLIARRAMELGGWPMRTITVYCTSPCHTLECGEEECDTPPPVNLSRARLMKTISRIDPDLAHMIESLAPVYLVKK